MTSLADRIARKVNAIWVRCSKGKLDLSECPSDRDIALAVEAELRKPKAAVKAALKELE